MGNLLLKAYIFYSHFWDHIFNIVNKKNHQKEIEQLKKYIPFVIRDYIDIAKERSPAREIREKAIDILNDRENNPEMFFWDYDRDERVKIFFDEKAFVEWCIKHRKIDFSRMTYFCVAYSYRELEEEKKKEKLSKES